MRAVISHDIGEASVEEVPKPTPRGGEILIEVKRVQVSITECEIYEGKSDKNLSVLHDRLSEGDGRLFGHEFSGVVDETGEGVVGFSKGDRVYAPGKLTCGECVYCRADLEHLCSNKQIIGRHISGALAEYVALPSELITQLPDDVSFAEGAAMQPMVSSYLIVNDTQIQNGDVVAVIGTGVMGATCAQFAQQQGAGEVLVIDIEPSKLSIAKEWGMTPVNAKHTDPVEKVKELTDGIGADVAFEAVGGEQDHTSTGTDPLAQAFNMVRPGGKVMQVGHVAGQVTADPRWMRGKGVKWLNPINNKEQIGPNANAREIVPDLVATGQVSISEYITHDLKGLHAFDEAIDITLNKQEYDALSPAQIVL